MNGVQIEKTIRPARQPLTPAIATRDVTHRGGQNIRNILQIKQSNGTIPQARASEKVIENQLTAL